MLLESTDLISILIIFTVLFASAFALFFPLAALFRDYKKALHYSIPLSISIQIIFAYPFYSFGPLKAYPIIYSAVILAINLFSLIKLYRYKILRPRLPRVSFLGGAVFLTFAAALIFSRFYDSATNIAPGTIDAYAHFRYLFHDLATIGRLSYAPYPPGFHLFLYPLTLFLPGSEIYRFAGPTLGVLITLSIYVLFKDIFNNKISKYLLLLLLILPILNQLTLQTIGFFPSALTFIFLPFLIYLLAQPKELSGKISAIFYLLTIVALGLTVPYLFAQYIPALIAILLLTLVLKKKFGRPYRIYALKLLSIAILGFFIAFAHIYLQTTISKHGEGFPVTEITYDENNELIISKKYREMNLHLDNLLRKYHFYNESRSDFLHRYLTPLLTTGEATITMKGIRPLNNFLSAGAYLWTLLSIFVSYLAVKKKNRVLLITSVFSVIFGLVTITGILEMPNYLGRSGWYLMLLALLGTTLIFDEVIQNRKLEWIGLKIVPLSLLLTVASSFAFPPTFYRAYYTEPFEIIYKIIKSYPHQSIYIFSDEYRLSLLSEDLVIQPLSADKFEKGCAAGKCFLILEKKLPKIDPVLSQEAYASDRDFEEFNRKQEALKTYREKVRSEIVSSKNFSSFKPYWENENIIVYERY
ncbi:MAG: hypothetical protein OEV37_02410 [Candidatus Berkelbacteria bacterium]|nr:hypothetical protein [Candidatus Berkelbacteria bacterium]